MAVAGQLDVDLGHGGTGAPGKLQRRQRVLWRHSREPAMGRDQRPAGAPGEQLHQTFPNPAARHSCFNLRSATNIRMMVGTSRTIATTAAQVKIDDRPPKYAHSRTGNVGTYGMPTTKVQTNSSRLPLNGNSPPA